MAEPMSMFNIKDLVPAHLTELIVTPEVSESMPSQTKDKSASIIEPEVEPGVVSIMQSSEDN